MFEAVAQKVRFFAVVVVPHTGLPPVLESVPPLVIALTDRR
jgi:hypothetical protein